MFLNFKEKRGHCGKSTKCTEAEKRMHMLLLTIPSFQFLVSFQFFLSVFFVCVFPKYIQLYILLFFLSSQKIFHIIKPSYKGYFNGCKTFNCFVYH